MLNDTRSVKKHIWQLQVFTSLFNLAFYFQVKEHRLAAGTRGSQQAKVRNLQSFCERSKVHRILVVNFDEVILAVLLNSSQSANECVVPLELWPQITQVIKVISSYVFYIVLEPLVLLLLLFPLWQLFPY